MLRLEKRLEKRLLAPESDKVGKGWKMGKRIKTKYPGVFYRESNRIGGSGPEKVFYIVFKKKGQVFEESVGSYRTKKMTAAKANNIRGQIIGGKRLTKRDKKILEKKQEELKAQQEKDENNKYTINKLWKEYKKNKPGLKGIKTYESQYALHVKPYFGDKEPRELLQLDIDRRRIAMLKKRDTKTKKPVWSSQTIKHVLSLLSRIIRFGVKKQLSEGLNFEIELPKVNNKKTEELSNKQLTKLLKAINADIHPQAGPMMKMALYTGMRRGELFRLKWRDINYDSGFIQLRDTKSGHDAKIPLNDAARSLLESHFQSGPYVFPGLAGRQRVNISKQVRKIADAAGLPKDFRPLHGLRHAYASMLASSGKIDMYTLQKLLNHRDPAMTQRYAHLHDHALRRASDLAGNIIENAIKKKTEEKEEIKSKVVNLNSKE